MNIWNHFAQMMLDIAKAVCAFSRSMYDAICNASGRKERYAVRHGRRQIVLLRKKGILKKFGPGDVVAIDVKDGSFIRGSLREKVVADFRSSFGERLFYVYEM